MTRYIKLTFRSILTSVLFYLLNYNNEFKIEQFYMCIRKGIYGYNISSISFAQFLFVLGIHSPVGSSIVLEIYHAFQT